MSLDYPQYENEGVQSKNQTVFQVVIFGIKCDDVKIHVKGYKRTSNVVIIR